MISYRKFKQLFNKLEGEPELEVYFNDINDTYMIIKYKDYITFQRCGIETGSCELKFNNLDELYNTITIDNICLKNDWKNIQDIIIDSVCSIENDKEDIKNIYDIEI